MKFMDCLSCFVCISAVVLVAANGQTMSDDIHALQGEVAELREALARLTVRMDAGTFKTDLTLNYSGTEPSVRPPGALYETV